MLLANRLLNDWAGYRVFTNVLEIRQTFELQTDRGNRIFDFSGGNISMEFFTEQELQTKNVWKYRPTAM
jgi:hypothetical protein